MLQIIITPLFKYCFLHTHTHTIFNYFFISIWWNEGICAQLLEYLIIWWSICYFCLLKWRKDVICVDEQFPLTSLKNINLLNAKFYIWSDLLMGRACCTWPQHGNLLHHCHSMFHMAAAWEVFAACLISEATLMRHVWSLQQLNSSKSYI